MQQSRVGPIESQRQLQLQESRSDQHVGTVGPIVDNEEPRQILTSRCIRLGQGRPERPDTLGREAEAGDDQPAECVGGMHVVDPEVDRHPQAARNGPDALLSHIEAQGLTIYPKSLGFRRS